jgi:hypothetical protein
MINISSEPTIPLTTVCRELGADGKALSLSTVLRWILKGVRGPHGQRVRLRACRLGGRWITSRSAVQEFANQLTPRIDDPAPAPRTPGQRRRAVELAKQQLEKVGI